MELAAFFQKNNKVGIAFSGGVDSAFLLMMAARYAREVRAYYVKSEFQPAFELEDAKRLARELGIQILTGTMEAAQGKTLRILEMSVLEVPGVWENPSNRCYYCKRGIFGEIWKAAREDGVEVLLDGTNASDDVADRPGMKALCELKVRSPLRECGLTKQRIRELSREEGLFTWNKPAYACLATRIPGGEPITVEKLQNTEAAEAYLFSIGFTDFRVRYRQGQALLQLKEEDLERLLMRRKEILTELSKYYQGISLDLKVRPAEKG